MARARVCKLQWLAGNNLVQRRSSLSRVATGQGARVRHLVAGGDWPSSGADKVRRRGDHGDELRLEARMGRRRRLAGEDALQGIKMHARGYWASASERRVASWWQLASGLRKC